MSNLNKALALINTFASGDTEKAASLLAEGYIQHNLAYGTGRDAFVGSVAYLASAPVKTTVNNIRAFEDADKVFGIKPEGFDVTSTGGQIDQRRFQSVGEQLMKRFPRAKKVIITLRGSINANHNTWGGVLWDGKTLYQSPRYDITHIVDRVGGGDSFMGGLIYGLLTYTGDDQKALNFAVAASCLKHTIFGDYNQVTVAEVENLMKGDASGRVSR